MLKDLFNFSQDIKKVPFAYDSFSFEHLMYLISQISPEERKFIKQFLTDILPDNVKISIDKGGD